MPEPDTMPLVVLSLKLRLLIAKVRDFRVEGSLGRCVPAIVDFPEAIDSLSL